MYNLSAAFVTLKPRPFLYVRKSFSCDKKLPMFDLQIKSNLAKQEIEFIKTIAVNLLAKVKARITTLDHYF